MSFINSGTLQQQQLNSSFSFSSSTSTTMQLDYYQAAAAAVADEWSLLAWLQIIYQTSLATNAKRNNKKLWTQTTQELITGLGAPLTNNNQFTIGEEERASLVHTPLGLLFFFFCTETVATSSNCCTVVSSSGAATRKYPCKTWNPRLSSETYNLTVLFQKLEPHNTRK